jgi:hypothetical protein
MVNIDRLYWATEYLDGRTEFEHEEHLSIRNAAPGAMTLVVQELLEDETRRPVLLVNLAAPDGYSIPVFYRRRGITLDGSDPMTLAVVFGRARLGSNGLDAQLWMAEYGGSGVVDCTPEHVDKDAVQLIAEAFS